MCYSLYLSTSSRKDLNRWNSELLSFQRLSGDEPEAVSLTDDKMTTPAENMSR